MNEADEYEEEPEAYEEADEPEPSGRKQITTADLYKIKKCLDDASKTIAEASIAVQENASHLENPDTEHLTEKMDNTSQLIWDLMNEFDFTLSLCSNARTELEENNYLFYTKLFGISSIVSNPEAKTTEGIEVAPALRRINAQLTVLDDAFANMLSPEMWGVKVERVGGRETITPFGSIPRAVFCKRTHEALGGVMSHHLRVATGVIPTLCAIIKELTATPQRLAEELERVRAEKVLLEEIRDGVEELKVQKEAETPQEVEEALEGVVEEEKPDKPRASDDLTLALPYVTQNDTTGRLSKGIVTKAVKGMIEGGMEDAEEIMGALQENHRIVFQNHGIYEAVSEIVDEELERTVGGVEEEAMPSYKDGVGIP